MPELDQETKEALLEAIKAFAPKAGSAGALQALGYAYALTVGATTGRLPGYNADSK